MKNRILYVIVIYKCKLENSTAFKSLLKHYPSEYRNIFVWDDSPYMQDSSIEVGSYNHDIENHGLGKAYNNACNYAINNGYNWMLLLDQDTLFPINALKSYEQALAEYSSQNMIVPRHIISTGEYMSPTHYNMYTSDLCDKAPTGIVTFKDACPINSGILISTKSFMSVGGYNDKIWLDFSDIAFIDKYKAYYPNFYVMPDVVCEQTFSAIETDRNKVYARYCIYLECARNFRTTQRVNSIYLTITVLRPAISRMVKEHSLKYIKAFWKYYIKNNKRNEQK